jgi:hypothetical protein
VNLLGGPPSFRSAAAHLYACKTWCLGKPGTTFFACLLLGLHRQGVAGFEEFSIAILGAVQKNLLDETSIPLKTSGAAPLSHLAVHPGRYFIFS